MKKTYITSAMISATMALTATCAHSAGYMIQETNGTMGQAFAGRAVAIEDASTMFVNPAVMAYQDKHQLIVQNFFIMPKSKLHTKSATTTRSSATTAGVTTVTTNTVGNNGGNGGQFAYVPATYAIVNYSKKFKFGLGITSPWGLETNYKPGFVGRYMATKSRLMTVNVNPAIAYRGECWSFGFGISFERAEADLEKAVNIDVRTLRGTQSDALSKVRGTNNAFGLNFGAIFEPCAKTRVGIAYRSRVDHNLKGFLSFSNLPNFGALANTAFARNFTDQRVSAHLKTPDVINLSGAYDINNAWSVLGDVMFTKWTVLRQITIVSKANGIIPTATEVQSWRNTIMASLGLNYRPNDNWLIRAGFAFDQSPTKNKYRTPRLPDQDRYWLAGGVDYNWCDQVGLKLAYTHIFIRDAKINNTVAGTRVPVPGVGNPLLLPGSNVQGKFKSHTDIIGLQLLVKL